MTAPLRKPALVLPAPGPQAWLDTHLRARFDDRYEDEVGDRAVDVVTISDLLADDAALVRDHHERLVADGTPAPAAATYLAAWYGGTIAGAVGYGLAAARAGFLVGPAGDGVRLHLHADGWPTRIELPARALVLQDHPWAHERSRVAPDLEVLLARTVHNLVSAVSPIIEACHRTARVGVIGLWNEVADELGKAVAYQHRVRPTPGMVAVLAAAVAVEGVPWKAKPRLGFAESERLGAVHVSLKGGCCLAYTVARDHVPKADDPDLSPYLRAYLGRFPIDPDTPRYCSTCSFRTPADAEARQVFWYEHHAPAISTPPPTLAPILELTDHPHQPETTAPE